VGYVRYETAAAKQAAAAVLRRVVPVPPMHHGGLGPQVPGDPLASLDVLRRVTGRIGEFLGRIVSGTAAPRGDRL
jgi:hypothetical protein